MAEGGFTVPIKGNLIKVKIGDSFCSAMVDTGASVSVIQYQFLNTLAEEFSMTVPDRTSDVKSVV